MAIFFIGKKSDVSLSKVFNVGSDLKGNNSHLEQYKCAIFLKIRPMVGRL